MSVAMETHQSQEVCQCTMHSRNSFIEDVTQLLCRVGARWEPISLKVSQAWINHTGKSPIRLNGKVHRTAANQSLTVGGEDEQANQGVAG